MGCANGEPVNQLTLGTCTYNKAQLLAILTTATGSLPDDVKPAQALLKLSYQLIPAMLGQANYAGGACNMPPDISANITAALALVGDRRIPPFGNGLAPCCATSSCPAGSTCCTQLTSAEVTFISSTVLGPCPSPLLLPPPGTSLLSTLLSNVTTMVSSLVCPPKTLGSCCTGAPDFWLTAGICQWPVTQLTLGSITYTKEQLAAIMTLNTCSLPAELLPAQPLLSLAYQLIAAMLSQANYASGATCVPPPHISANITAALALIGDRQLPPYGNGLAPCCATNTCPAGSTCCTHLTSADVSLFVSVALGPWSSAGQCSCGLTTLPSPPSSQLPPPPLKSSPPPPPSSSPLSGLLSGVVSSVSDLAANVTSVVSSLDFWLTAGICQWPVAQLTLGSVAYTKEQLAAIMTLNTCTLPAELLPTQPLLSLAYQLIAAMLSQANYASGATCIPPPHISANITAAIALIGDRRIPPYGNGLAPCCATNTCPTGSTCCTQLTSADVSVFASVALGPWSSAGQCSCGLTALPPPLPAMPPPPPPDSAFIIGDPHWLPFSSPAGTPWNTLKGSAGQPYTLYTDGWGTKLTCTLGLGGAGGKATFVRALAFTRGANTVTALLVNNTNTWVLSVTANGRVLGAEQSAALGSGISVKATPTLSGRPGGLSISLPYLLITAQQKASTKPAQMANPGYGQWLDVYLQVLAGPLPAPVGGLLGSGYRPPTTATATSMGAATATAMAVAQVAPGQESTAAIITAFSQCQSLPKTQSCDSVATAQAKAIAYAIAHAAAYAAGSVKGGSGCSGVAKGEASAKATALATAYADALAHAGCAGSTADASSHAVQTAAATASAKASSLVSGSAGAGGSIDLSGSASAVQDTITPAVAEALATALATSAVSSAVSQAFADCKSKPKTESCDSVAQARAQAIAYAIAHASAYAAGSVKGGPGCTGKAQQTAEAKATALATAYAKALADAGCSGSSASASSEAIQTAVATASAKASSLVVGSAGPGGSVDVSGSASAVQDAISPAVAEALATALATCA
ncbi:hypothetical protein ABPG75_005288 [Micractinium tetrahymenae]